MFVENRFVHLVCSIWSERLCSNASRGVNRFFSVLILSLNNFVESFNYVFVFVVQLNSIPTPTFLWHLHQDFSNFLAFPSEPRTFAIIFLPQTETQAFIQWGCFQLVFLQIISDFRQDFSGFWRFTCFGKILQKHP